MATVGIKELEDLYHRTDVLLSTCMLDLTFCPVFIGCSFSCWSEDWPLNHNVHVTGVLSLKIP